MFHLRFQFRNGDAISPRPVRDTRRLDRRKLCRTSNFLSFATVDRSRSSPPESQVRRIAPRPFAYGYNDSQPVSSLLSYAEEEIRAW